MCVYIFTHTQLETIKFVKHLQLMSSLHFRLGDAESVVNAMYIYLRTEHGVRVLFPHPVFECL